MAVDRYKGKYRVPSARWAVWDYGRNAAYFVTICIANRAHGFGAIAYGEMALTSLGHAAADCWDEIPAHFPFVRLDGFVVMPNHVHGIIVIDKPVDVDGDDVETPVETRVETRVETQDFASLRNPTNRFGPQSQNLASIVRGYKIGVTKYARRHDIPFKWQARYHDHVIRNADEYERIRQYILANPRTWDEDRYYVP